jgi:hypothetical protein
MQRSGEIAVPVQLAVPIREWMRAFDLLAERRTEGKLLLRVEKG